MNCQVVFQSIEQNLIIERWDYFGQACVCAALCVAVTERVSSSPKLK